MSSPVTTGAGSRRCASSPAATAASRTRPAGTRRRACPPTGPPTRRTGQSPTRSPCWTGSACAAPTWSACRWAGSPPCTWCCATRTGSPPRWWPAREEGFRAECQATAAAFEAEGAERVAARYAVGPARVQLQNKNPRGWAEFAAALAGHSALGAALTMRGVQAARPSLYNLRDKLAQVRTPVLLVVGDEDEGCLEPALMLKRTIPTSGLAILPRTGHTANLEEPDVFNRVVDRFLAAVERGAWRPRD